MIRDEHLREILEAARLAPSANNSQVWRFFLTRQRPEITWLASLANKPSFLSAPLILVAMAEPWIIGTRGKEQPFFMIDVPIALSHIILKSVEYGMSVALCFDFDEEKLLGTISDMLKNSRGKTLPTRERAVALVAIGYAEQSKKPQRG